MNFFFFFAFFFFFVFTKPYSAKWRASSFPTKVPFLTSTFGESRGDHFHNGVDFAGKQEIFSIEEGEILLYNNDIQKNPYSPNFGSGNYVVIEHKKKIRSFYFHLEKNSIPENITKVNTDTSIAVMGNSGHSTGNHLHFFIYDIEEKKIVNPFFYLPEIQDDSKPIIYSFLVKIKNNFYPLKSKSTIRYFGKISLFIVSWDRLSKKESILRRKGLKKLSFFVDDKLDREYDFDSMSLKENEFRVNDYIFKDVYGKSFNYKVGDFTPKKNKYVFKIRAEDWHGNFQEKIYKVNFFYR